MGYYATATGSVIVPAENVDAAYEALVLLNTREDLKSGGSWGGIPAVKPADSTSVASSPDKWFSWMDWNYDEVETSAQSIIEKLGFEVEKLHNGGFEVYAYDNKVGAEKHFMEALAPFVLAGSEMTWTGEDGEMWRWTFDDGVMKEWEAVITWV